MRNERSGCRAPTTARRARTPWAGKFCGSRMTRTRSPWWPEHLQEGLPLPRIARHGRSPAATWRRDAGAHSQRDAGGDAGRHRPARAHAEELSTPNSTRKSSRRGEPDHRRRALAPQERLLLLEHQQQLRLVVADVAGEEVEDAVPPRVEPGGEGRPGDRRLRGDRRAQRREGALGAQLRQVGQLALVHPPLGELGVGAVEEDDRLRRWEAGGGSAGRGGSGATRGGQRGRAAHRGLRGCSWGRTLSSASR